MSEVPIERQPNLRPSNPPLYINRELSWLAFNERVLEEVYDPRIPLLERLRFLTIFHTNLDEFFMIRVSGLQQQISAGLEVLSMDGTSPRSQLQQIYERIGPLLNRASRCLREELIPQLLEQGFEVVRYKQLSSEEKEKWDHWYLENVHPILTPLAVSPTHPFPFISNLSLNLALFVRSPTGEERLARVKVPAALPRFISLDNDEFGSPGRYLPLEQLIAANLTKLFPGMKLSKPVTFRVTRDADVAIKEDEAEDLLQVLQERLRRRRFGQAVRLQVQSNTPEALREALRVGLDLEASSVQEQGRLLSVSDLSVFCKIDLPELKYPPFVPKVHRSFDSEEIFASIRDHDILLHHPFDSFAPVVDFIRSAAHDPNVVAIKQTLYRTNGNSPIIEALEEAVDNGKQVAVLVELKARFDEENNIVWARRLEHAGVHVVYGIVGLKTHCKLSLVVREEKGMLRRYAHIATGNYNSITARVYTDLGLMTTNKEITADVADCFNRLTGFGRPENYRKLMVAPDHMKQHLLALIAFETQEALDGREGHIIAKCNAVADIDVINALYEASGAGVKIDLLVRGICCLVPGHEGLSENISVRSVVGRFLEHSRVYWFHNAGKAKCYLGSADWMDRNLNRRVEVLAPITSKRLRKWVRGTYLQRYLDDRANTRTMRSDGRYQRTRLVDGEEPDVHRQFLEDR
jgi:polyphosphate kinase